MTMIANPPDLPIPLRMDEYGKFRVGDSRVLLELVIHAYYNGETPEGIVESYPTLKIADVYAVIAYYLTYPEEIDAYLRDVDRRTEEILQELKENQSPETRALRARLRAHKQ
jgi:uncharacterized protein (DUF433 family)